MGDGNAEAKENEENESNLDGSDLSEDNGSEESLSKNRKRGGKYFQETRKL